MNSIYAMHSPSTIQYNVGATNLIICIIPFFFVPSLEFMDAAVRTKLDFDVMFASRMIWMRRQDIATKISYTLNIRP